MTNYIYILKDPISLKIRYVGKTSKPTKRIKRHMCNSSLAESWTKKNKWLLNLKKSNLLPIIEIIDETDGNINDLEIKWIKHYRDMGIGLTNMTDGGDGCSHNKGKKLTKDTINRMKHNHPFRKDIIRLDLENNTIKFYESSHDCEKDGFNRSNVTRCCKGIYQSIKGHYFRFIDNYFPCPKSINPPNITYINSRIEEYRKSIPTIKSKAEMIKDKSKINRKRKKIVQYDLSGNIINHYNSLLESSKKSGCHIYLISNCCKKKSYYTTKGYTFRYEGDPFDYIPYNKSIQITSRKVCKYDLDGKLINIYDSVKQAAREIKDRDSNIIQCCKKKIKKNGKFITVKGYTWRYFEETEGENLFSNS